MKTPHLLQVALDPDAYGDLFRAAAEAGLRIGWLEYSSPVPPPDLGAAARLGALRAVAVGEEGSLSVKPRRGLPVLRDLLREHFRGCALVLVRGAVDAPCLESEGAGWRLVAGTREPRSLTTEQLVAALRRPSPWGR
ncbi:MAG: hypothetical protein KDD47_21475 [Acidobacteria bacterium]|nr:hypothetical protein [Acidobacteriota bacterium]